MGPDSYIKNLITTHQPQVRDNHFHWIYHHNKFSTLKKSKTPWCALQKIEHVFSRLITDFKNNYSHAEVDELMLDRLKILEDRIQQKVLDYKSKYGKAYLFFSKVFLGSIDKLSQELIDEIKKLQNRKGCEKPDKKEPLSPYSIDDLLTNEGLQNFSEENLDHTPSLDVDNTIKNTRIEGVDFTKVEFEFICSDGQS